jgi:hypothetical protein
MGDKKRIKLKPSKELCDKTNEAVEKVSEAIKDSFGGVYYALADQTYESICKFFNDATEKIKKKIREKGKTKDET